MSRCPSNIGQPDVQGDQPQVDSDVGMRVRRHDRLSRDRWRDRQNANQPHLQLGDSNCARTLGRQQSQSEKGSTAPAHQEAEAPRCSGLTPARSIVRSSRCCPRPGVGRRNRAGCDDYRTDRPRGRRLMAPRVDGGRRRGVGGGTAGGQPGSFLRAASYYGAALALIAGSDGFVDETASWTRQRECGSKRSANWAASGSRSHTRRWRRPASSSPAEKAGDQ